jgi:hypothetical protein
MNRWHAYPNISDNFLHGADPKVLKWRQDFLEHLELQPIILSKKPRVPIRVCSLPYVSAHIGTQNKLFAAPCQPKDSPCLLNHAHGQKSVWNIRQAKILKRLLDLVMT